MEIKIENGKLGKKSGMPHVMESESSKSDLGILRLVSTVRIALARGGLSSLYRTQLYRPEKVRFRYRLAGLDSDWVERMDVELRNTPTCPRDNIFSASRLPTRTGYGVLVTQALPWYACRHFGKHYFSVAIIQLNFRLCHLGVKFL